MCVAAMVLRQNQRHDLVQRHGSQLQGDQTEWHRSRYTEEGRLLQSAVNHESVEKLQGGALYEDSSKTPIRDDYGECCEDIHGTP